MKNTNKTKTKSSDIDWTTYPCESCSNYHVADDCICGKLDEWSIKQRKIKPFVGLAEKLIKKFDNMYKTIDKEADDFNQKIQMTSEKQRCSNDNSTYSNEHLMDAAKAYADTHVVSVDDCPYTPSDTKHIVRDAYYAGFEDFYKTIVKPMYDVFLKTNSSENPYNQTYKMALEDIIKVSGFQKNK